MTLMAIPFMLEILLRLKWNLTVVKTKEYFTLRGPFTYNGNLEVYCDGCWGGPPKIIGNKFDNPEILQAQSQKLKE